MSRVFIPKNNNNKTSSCEMSALKSIKLNPPFHPTKLNHNHQARVRLKLEYNLYKSPPPNKKGRFSIINTNKGLECSDSNPKLAAKINPAKQTSTNKNQPPARINPAKAGKKARLPNPIPAPASIGNSKTPAPPLPMRLNAPLVCAKPNPPMGRQTQSRVLSRSAGEYARGGFVVGGVSIFLID
jgi:hypothetical protein